LPTQDDLANIGSRIVMEQIESTTISTKKIINNKLKKHWSFDVEEV
jgi:hypothetical protein